MACQYFFPRAERVWLAQSHATGFVPKARLELIISCFLCFNCYIKLALFYYLLGLIYSSNPRILHSTRTILQLITSSCTAIQWFIDEMKTASWVPQSSVTPFEFKNVGIYGVFLPEDIPCHVKMDFIPVFFPQNIHTSWQNHQYEDELCLVKFIVNCAVTYLVQHYSLTFSKKK